jgi:protein SCO1/2
MASHSMKAHHGLIWLGLVGFLVSCSQKKGDSPSATAARTNAQTFDVRGTVRELKPDGLTAVIRHEAISNYMEAMTMPFRAKATNELAGLQPGDIVAFRLFVTDDESWIDRVTRTGRIADQVSTNTLAPAPSVIPPRINIVDGLATFAFTNEFGQPVNFGDFKGQAIGLTFFFTRCPLPEYCPRLTKNFASATRKLQALPGAPTNWHLFSVSFDTQIDSPAVLRGYAKAYGYDSNRWSFVTSSQATIDEVARRFNFNFKKEGGTFTHHFFTVVLDSNGYWHAGWPVGGDTSDNLVQEIVKAASPGK